MLHLLCLCPLTFKEEMAATAQDLTSSKRPEFGGIKKGLKHIHLSMFSGYFHLSPDASIAIMQRLLLPSATLILSPLCKFPLKTQDGSTEASEDSI